MDFKALGGRRGKRVKWTLLRITGDPPRRVILQLFNSSLNKEICEGNNGFTLARDLSDPAPFQNRGLLRFFCPSPNSPTREGAPVSRGPSHLAPRGPSLLAPWVFPLPPRVGADERSVNFPTGKERENLWRQDHGDHVEANVNLDRSGNGTDVRVYQSPSLKEPADGTDTTLRPLSVFPSSS